MSASDASALGVTNKVKAGGKKGDGNWCLVDAEWCMVHVMTEQARFNYDIEGIWRELEVGKSTKPKPWEDQSSFASGPSSMAEAARPSRPRTKRDLFGESLGNKKRASAGSSSTSAASKFGGGSSWRSFSTSVRSATAAASSSATQSTTTTAAVSAVPESLSQLLTRAQQSFSSGATDPIPVSVKGWLRSTRKQKSITFLELSDGSLRVPERFKLLLGALLLLRPRTLIGWQV